MLLTTFKFSFSLLFLLNLLKLYINYKLILFLLYIFIIPISDE